MFGSSHLETCCECFAFSVNSLHRFSHLLSADVPISILVKKKECRMLFGVSAWALGAAERHRQPLKWSGNMGKSLRKQMIIALIIGVTKDQQVEQRTFYNEVRSLRTRGLQAFEQLLRQLPGRVKPFQSSVLVGLGIFQCHLPNGPADLINKDGRHEFAPATPRFCSTQSVALLLLRRMVTTRLVLLIGRRNVRRG